MAKPALPHSEKPRRTTPKDTQGTSTVYYVRTDLGEPHQAGAEKLRRLIDRSGLTSHIKKDDFIAIKLHFGEDGNTGSVKPFFVREIVDKVKTKTPRVFLTDTNVLYKDSRRTNTLDHLEIAYEHGFTQKEMSVPIIIADGLFGTNFTEIPVGLKHFKSVKIAPDIAACDSLVVISHLTGHMMTGIGAALKNLGMGCASRRGKYEQHSGAIPDIDISHCTGCGLCIKACPPGCLKMSDGKASIDRGLCIGCGECVVVCRTKAIDIKWSETLENMQEKMVEYACGAVKSVGLNAFYINFVMDVTKECDCLAKDEERISKDIGILASRDPVSIDMASAELVNDAMGRDIFRDLRPGIDWRYSLKYAEDVGLGNIRYNLIEV
jgi:uncharacterized Fe-S center protein